MRQLVQLHDTPAEAILASSCTTTVSPLRATKGFDTKKGSGGGGDAGSAVMATARVEEKEETLHLAPRGDRCVQLPATSATLRELHAAMLAAAEGKGLATIVAKAPVTAELDPELDALIARMAPLGVDSTRLKLPTNPPLRQIVEEYIEDFVLV